MRRLLLVLGVVVLTAILVVGLRQAGDRSGDVAEEPPFDLRAARAELRGSPPPLAALHEQSGALLEGGVPAFRKRLRDLRGHPVVINKWASWCDPCRAEFPALQRVATDRGREVAFLGLNSGDSLQPARRFLASFPTPYPSYVDPDEDIARALEAPANYPVTVFLDARGEPAFIHQGAYRSSADLAADIDRYLGGDGT
ncbi:MAG TPA: TlpA disulfide reductase family protein [Solirubrobacteraceae bacterium]|nr:TlpA disulfide reductase family protein [Solirubrobacteraceae bacterium]